MHEGFMQKRSPTSNWERHGRLALGLVLAGALAAGCGDSANDDVKDSAGSAGDLGAASESSESRTDLAGQLGALVSELEEDFPGEVGIAVSGASQTSSAGVAGEGPAWSTIKAPIAIAALRDGASPELVNLAIEQSDNDAAYALWSQVKWSEDNATAAIDEVLAEGDSRVQWQSPDDYGDVSFGYATWPLREQAPFAAHLRCIAGSHNVYDAMSNLVDWQSYGLAELQGAHVKGGWGLDEDTGIYTQRQIGSLELGEGSIGVAIVTTQNENGSEDGEEDSGGVGIEGTCEEASYGRAVEVLNKAAARIPALVDSAVAAGELDPVESC